MSKSTAWPAGVFERRGRDGRTRTISTAFAPRLDPIAALRHE